MELSNCSLHLVYPEVGPSIAGPSDRRRPLRLGRNPSFLTFCRILCLLGARKHSKMSSKRHKNEHKNDVIWSYLNVDIFLGRCLEKFNAQLIGKLLSAFKGNYTLVFHITLISDQYHLCIVPRICLNLCNPAYKGNTLYFSTCCTWTKLNLELFTSPELSWSFLRLWCRT